MDSTQGENSGIQSYGVLESAVSHLVIIQAYEFHIIQIGYVASPDSYLCRCIIIHAAAFDFCYSIC